MKKTKLKNKPIRFIKIESIRFSPEFEVEFCNFKTSEKLIDRHTILKGWEIDYDGSLEAGCEFRPKKSNHLFFNEDSLNQIKEMLALIRVYRGKISPRCGLHIHIDAKRFTSRQILNILQEWIHKQRYIVKKFNVSKERLEQYCKLLPTDGIKKITVKKIERFRRSDGLWSSEFYDYFEDKHRSLNISHLPKNDYGTLEFRLFGGTLKFKEIKERILWILEFIKNAVERD